MSDILIRPCGHGRDACYLVAPETDAGQRWLYEHATLDKPGVWDGVATCAPPIMDGLVRDAIADGLSVEVV
jgi:hypothetical protein